MEILVGVIMTAIVPVPTRSNFSGVTHQGNWPINAVFAVEYRLRDKQFASVDHGLSVEYFETHEAMNLWFDEKLEFFKSTDWDFSMTYVMYEWDLGPNVVKYGSM